MKFKKVLFPCAIAALMLVGCTGQKQGGEDLKGTYNVTLWVSEVAGVADQFAAQIRAFEAENEGIKIVETIEGVSESSSATQVLTDIDAAADIYCFAQDQTARLIEGGALAKLGKAAAEKVKEENDAGSVLAVTGGNDLYAYPLTSDNGYFMYYDKSVITEDVDITNFEAILAKCEATSHSFTMAASDSAWYLASWFFGTGCTSTWTTDEEGKINGVVDTFNDPVKGLAAAKGLYKLVKSTAHKDASSVSAFEDATPAAVVVSGTWDYTTAAGILGENLGVAELPYFHVGEEAYHLGSFSGNKLLGVKPQSDTKKAAVMSKLALYLTGEKCQKERFDQFAWGPSNKVVQNSDAVKANPALAALAKQNQYAKPQGQIHGSWWDIAKVIATDVKATDGSDEQLQAALDAYAAKLADIFEVHPWGIVGSMSVSNWSTNIEMTLNANGTWEITYEFAEGDLFKVRCGGDWNTFGTLTITLCDGITQQPDGDRNLVVGTAGTYKLVVDPVALTLVITAQ